MVVKNLVCFFFVSSQIGSKFSLNWCKELEWLVFKICLIIYQTFIECVLSDSPIMGICIGQ